jgi:Flp pilus assembly protein TadD
MRWCAANLRAALKRPLRLVLAVLLLGLIAAATYVAGWELWAAHQLRAGRQALEAGDLKQARERLGLCLRVYRRNPDVHFLLARAARRAGEYGEMNRQLTKCERLGGLAEAVALERTLADAQQGRLAEADKYLRICLDQDYPESPAILDALAQGYVRTYRLPMAMLCLNRLLQLQPDNARALLLRAQANDQLRLADDSLADYRRVVQLDPENDTARHTLVVGLLDRSRTEEAMPHLRRLRERRPGDPGIAASLARCLVARGETAEARRLLEALLAEHPDHLLGMIQLGKAELADGNMDRARPWLEKVVQRSPNDREVLHNLAECYERLGRSGDARRCMDQVQAIDQGNKAITEVMIKMLRQPNDPALRLQAGQCFLKAGNAAEAVRWFESALREDPRHRPTHEALRDYYRQAGRNDLAAIHEWALQGKGVAGDGPPGKGPR